MTDDEKEKFPVMLANSLLSQGPLSGIKPLVTINGKTFVLGNDIHHFGLRMADIEYQKEGNDYYTYVGGNKIKGTDLWKVLKKYCEMLFSRALAEALSKSREKEKGNRGVSFYDFDAGTS